MVEPFQTLIDEQRPGGRELPEPLRTVYGPWPLPEASERPFVYANFVMSLDGRISFNTPGHGGGGDVSRRDEHDRWLMGLLRARADAILVGGSSIEAAGNHVWTPEAVAPEDSEAWSDLRTAENRSAVPLLVVLTRSGGIPRSAPVLDSPQLPVLIATTTGGAERARGVLGDRHWIRYLVTGEQLDNVAVLHTLRDEYNVQHLLVEGGPQILGALVAGKLLDDAFVTLSPILIGSSDQQPRPSLVEGVAFGFQNPPRLRLLSLLRNGDYLYHHYRLDPHI